MTPDAPDDDAAARPGPAPERGLRAYAPAASACSRFLLWTAAFTLAYTIAPLYESNQHTKFLAGLARGGFGHLAEDWLARTTNPFPLFTLLVAATYRQAGPFLFYLYTALLFGVFLFSMAGIATAIAPGTGRKTHRLYLAAIVLLHSRAADDLFRAVTGERLTELVHSGVAAKTILTHYLQPALFGVLLLLSCFLFLTRRWGASLLPLIGAGVVHPSYLFTAAPLLAGYAFVALRWDRRPLTAALILLLPAAALAPFVLYLGGSFDPAPPEVHAEAQRIIVTLRIPHHALPAVWLGPTAGFHLLWMLAGLTLLGRTRLFPALALAFAVSALLTALQVATGSLALASLIPWRNAVLLVPLATAAILARAARWLGRPAIGPLASRRWVSIATGAALGLVVCYGAIKQVRDLSKAREGEALPAMAAVRRQAAPGQIHLIPPTLSEFRLMTGQPAFVTRKSHPNEDREVLEWHRRLLLAEGFYASEGVERCRQAGLLARGEGITHVLTRSPEGLDRCEFATLDFQDAAYALFAVAPGS